MKSMTLGVFAYVLAFASTPGRAAIFDFSVTTGDGGEMLGLLLASGVFFSLAGGDGVGESADPSA